MKKLYSLFTLFAVAMVAFAASAAKTVNITLDNPDAVYFFETAGYNYTSPNGQSSLSLSLADNANLVIYCNEGAQLESVTVDGKDFGGAKGQTNFALAPGDLSNGCNVNITTSAPKTKTLIVKADASKVTVQDFNYNTLDASTQVDGAWELQIPSSAWASMSIAAKDGYMVSSVTDQTGKSYLSSFTSYVSYYANEFENDQTTLTVEAKSNDELYDGKVTVNIEGDYYKVSFYAGQSSVSLNGSSNEVQYDSQSQVPFAISHSYNSSYNPCYLYKVSLNGVPQDRSADGTFHVTPANKQGDVIDIQVDAPEVMVPVTVTGDIQALARVNNGYDSLEKENFGSFSAKLGGTITLAFSTAGYDINRITVNGTDKTAGINEWGELNVEVDNENAINIDIKATARKPFEVTVLCDEWQALLLSKDYQGNEPYEMTGVETVFQVNPADNYLYVGARDGWMVKSIEDLDEHTYNGSVNITGDITLLIELEEYKRDQELTVYIEEHPWNYFQLVLARDNYEVTKYLTIGDGLQTGYNTVGFNPADLPLNVYGYNQNYDSPCVFLNNKLCQNNYGSYPELADVKDGDVLKVMTTDTTHELTYSVDCPEDVTIIHDRVSAADHTATHNVVPGTEVHVIKNESLSNTDATIEVKVNGTKIEPVDDSKYVFTVNAPSAVTVSKTTGVEDIAADNAAADANVYNLQGVIVARNGAQQQALPAGIYIRNGKKTIVK